MPDPRIRRSFGPSAYAPFLALLARVATDVDGLEPATQADELGFVGAALHHGVGAQALAAARDRRVILSDAGVKSLETGQLMRLVRGALLREELRLVAPVISAACGGLAPILVKGPALADRFYADPELRPFVDLDFLVPRDRLAQAASAVTDAFGYAPAELRWPQSAERHGHAIELSRVRVRHTLGLELHWRISDDPQASGLDYARLVSGASHRLGPVTDVIVCGPASQLVLLATHLLHHSRSDQRLIWLIDLAVVARAAEETEWRGAFALADCVGLGWVLHTALDEAERQLGLIRSRPNSPPGPIAWGPLRAAHVVGGPVGFHLGHLVTLGWRDRARYVARGACGRLTRAAARRASGQRSAGR